MIHELAHFKVRGHDEKFPAEFQFILYKLESYDKRMLDSYQNRLINAFSKYEDVFKHGWEMLNEAESVEARGKRFQDGSGETSSKFTNESVSRSERRSSGARRAGERIQPYAEESGTTTGKRGTATKRSESNEILQLKDEDLFRTGQVPPSPVMAKPDVEQAANETAQGWTNAPEIIVLDDENDPRIPKNIQISPNTKGFYKEGKTYVIASRANDRADVHATVLHESLGHFGLRQKFGTNLNDILNDIYDTNPTTRVAADAIKTPGMSNAQAVEEVLATKSEAGPIKEAGIRAAFNVRLS